MDALLPPSSAAATGTPPGVAPGACLLGRWLVTGPPRPLATGVLLPVTAEGRLRGRARVHWAALTTHAARRRLAGAARFLGAAPHPAILPLLEEGGEPGAVVHVTAEADGGDLLDRGLPLPWREAATAALGVAEALGAAHALGVLHRDVAPANLLVAPDGSIWLGDWDSGHFPSVGARAEEEAAHLGTPGFMSPEQESGDPLGPPSDIFSLGMTLRALLSGHPDLPSGTDGTERYARLSAGTLVPLAELVSGCPRALASVADATTAPDPGARPTAQALVSALEEVLR